MTETLSPAQSAALFDILTHYETYSEIRDFRIPRSLDHYGPPFSLEAKKESTAPALQALVSKFILEVPGLRDVPEDFWKVQIYEIIEQLEEANLSESYDKGAVGSRKTLATAVSALIEYPVRGTFGGFAEVKDPNHDYNLESAEDLGRGFRNFVDQCIYGSVLEDLVKKAAETDKLEEHGKLIKAVHEFVLVNLASFMHYTLILSPKGQYLLKLIENANRLIPYMAIRQALKIGNIATMMNALVRIILAKMSVTGLTNWIGLTANENDGMNLLQQIISTVLHWDIRDLESRVTKIEKDRSCPNKNVLNTLNDYMNLDLTKQDEIREHSQTSSNSIVMIILADAGKPSDMKEETHKLAMDYLSCKLSIRDRKEIVRVACHHRPDHLTTLVRTLFNVYEPVIRQFHDAVNLSDTVADFQAFVTDMLKVARIQPPSKDGTTVVPTVGDFIQLLRKHQYSSHKFIHQLCKNGKEVVHWYLDWAKQAASQFRRETPRPKDDQNDKESPRDAGDLTTPLNTAFKALPTETRSSILPVLDQQILYLDEMHSSSLHRLSTVIHSAPTTAPKSSTLSKVLNSTLPSSRPSSRSSSPARSVFGNRTKDDHSHPPSPTNASHDPSEIPHVTSDPGPGAYLARWQDLLDATPVTPLTATGKPHRASDKDIVERSAMDVDGGKMLEYGTTGGKTLDAQKVKPGVSSAATDGKKNKNNGARKPDVGVVVEALGDEFRRLLGERSLYW